MEERYLSLAEAREILGKTDRTLYRWIKSGKLKAYKPGRDYEIPESAIQEMRERSEVYPKVQAPLWPEKESERRDDEVLFEAAYSPENLEEAIAEAARLPPPEGMRIALLISDDKVEVRIVPATSSSSARRTRRSTRARSGRGTG